MAALEVESVNVVNNGLFVMSYVLEIFDEDILGWATINDWESGVYAIGGSQVKDLADFADLSEGTAIRPQVRVRAGGTASAPTYIRYTKNGQTATWEVTGTTFNIHIHQLGV